MFLEKAYREGIAEFAVNKCCSLLAESFYYKVCFAWFALMFGYKFKTLTIYQDNWIRL